MSQWTDVNEDALADSKFCICCAQEDADAIAAGVGMSGNGGGTAEVRVCYYLDHGWIMGLHCGTLLHMVLQTSYQIIRLINHQSLRSFFCDLHVLQDRLLRFYSEPFQRSNQPGFAGRP